MNPKSTPRATLTHIATALLVAGALHAASATAATFQYRHWAPGLVPPESVQLPVTVDVSLSLGGADLPLVVVGNSYHYDLKPSVTVTGDPTYNAADVSFSLVSGTLPLGLELSSNGIISGTGSAFANSGLTFTIQANYRSKSAQHTYTMYPGDALSAYNGNLLHMDGIDGSTAFTDATGKTVSLYGAPVISTAQYKFGGGSGYFNGSSYLSAASSNLSGNWTVETWLRPSSTGVMQTIMHFSAKGVTQRGVHIWRNSANQLVVDNGINAMPALGGTIPANTWTHIAVVRNGATTTGYINGIAVGSNSFVPGATDLVLVGRFSLTPYYMTGYYDDIRVTEGVARYTGNFTPPLAELPNK